MQYSIINPELFDLRQNLCKGTTDFCRDCFKGSPFAQSQNPPNVFRDQEMNIHPNYFFVFDKPNNCDRYRHSDLVPITIFDPRAEFSGNPTRNNLVKLFKILKITGHSEIDPLWSKQVHITNAVKCDKCAKTGIAGPVKIGEYQVKTCCENFFYQELMILQPKVIVFFGTYPERYIASKRTKLWEIRQETINGILYTMVRVPHCAPPPFNVYGEGGQAYKNNLGELFGTSQLHS